MSRLFSFVSDWRRRLIQEPIDARMRRAGEVAVGIAQNDWVPIRSGYLRNSIGFTYDPSQQLLILYADAPYGAAVEEGTIHMMARPYLRPALNAIGRMWGGNTQISYPTAYALSGRRGDPAVARHNTETSARLHLGASGRARVRYQGGRAVRQSRTRFRLILNHPSPNDATTPIL